MSKKRYADEEVAAAVSDAISYKEAHQKLTDSSSGSSYTHFVRRVKMMGLDTSHFDPYWFSKSNGSDMNTKRRYTPDQLLVFNEGLTRRVESKRLRRCMLEYGFIYECQTCRISEWQGKKVRLEIDHINGNWKDNSPENLRFLCPNCHSQCDETNYTYSEKRKEKEARRVAKKKLTREKRICECGNPKNRDAKNCNSCWSGQNSKIQWPATADLLRMVQLSGFSATGRQLGVSDNAVRKRLRCHQDS